MVKYRKKHPERILLNNARIRATKAGVPFNLSEKDVYIPDRCPVFGFLLVCAAGAGIHQDNSPSLDRIIPVLGYVKGNVQVLSWRANNLKKDATAAELQMLADFMAKDR